MNITEFERAKYARIWNDDQYSEMSPGVNAIPMFEKIVRPNPGAKILDVGAGSGAASRALRSRGYSVDSFDITDAKWNGDGQLILGSVWRGLPSGYEIGFCCDVMEHIPTQFVGLTVREILRSCQRAFLSICFMEDGFGDRIGMPLHLTVKPFVWWRDTLRECGQLLDARDLVGAGVFHVAS
jgi:hypothetical protein